MSTLTLKELSAPTGEVIKIAAGKTLDLNSQGTLILPTIPASKMPSGTVIAVYTSVLTSQVTFSSSSHTDSGLTVTLTPQSANSKFILTITGKTHIDTTSTNGATDHEIYRNSTLIQKGVHTNYFNRADFSSDYYPVFNLTHIDSPSTTSSVTYKMMGRKYGGSDAPWTLAASNAGTRYASLTIMEIQG